MPTTTKTCKKFRVENHLPQPIFIELWRKRNKGKITLYIRAYFSRPVSRYYVRKIAIEQALNVKLTEAINFDFISHLSRDAVGQVRPTDYGYLISFDFFAQGAN